VAAVCASIVAELDVLGWNNVLHVSPTLDHIVVQVSDSANRQHSLTLTCTGGASSEVQIQCQADICGKCSYISVTSNAQPNAHYIKLATLCIYMWGSAVR
jgi:hypothetical protein